MKICPASNQKAFNKIRSKDLFEHVPCLCQMQIHKDFTSILRVDGDSRCVRISPRDSRICRTSHCSIQNSPFSACVPSTVHFSDSTTPLSIQRNQPWRRQSSDYSIFRWNVDALLFAHCLPLPMHTMGECVSASFTKPFNLVLYDLSLHLHATAYIWMYCATVHVYGYMRSVHTASSEFTWYPILDSLIGALSCAPHNF